MKLAHVLDTKDTLVILRYPVSIKPDAVTHFQQLYDNRGFVNYFYHAPDDVETVRWIGKNTGLEAREPRDVAETHPEAIAKTTYFALAFYESLKKVLPPNAVRLQPVAIGQKAIQRGTSGALKWGENAPDALEEKPGIEYPPTVLYVDLFTYVHPYYRLGQPTSFGKFIAPLITVRTAPAAAPETLGGIVTPSAFLPYTRQPARDAGAAEGLGVSFVDYLNATAGVPPDHFPIPEKRLIEQLPIAPSNYLVLPVNQFEMGVTLILTIDALSMLA